MSRKNTRHIDRLQQLPRFVRAAVYNRLTIRHYRFFKERIIWHGPRYKILMNGSAANLAQTLKRRHRYDNKPRTSLYKSLHRDRRKLKRFIERARWAQEHPQDPLDAFFKTLRENFNPEEWKRQILNFPTPKPSGIAVGQLTYDDSPVMKPKQKMAIHVPASIDPYRSPYPHHVFPEIQDRILIKPDSPVIDALKMDMRHFFEPIKAPAIELDRFVLLEKERIQIANPEKTFIINASDVAPTEEK